jgi:hypothetical protein
VKLLGFTSYDIPQVQNSAHSAASAAGRSRSLARRGHLEVGNTAIKSTAISTAAISSTAANPARLHSTHRRRCVISPQAWRCGSSPALCDLTLESISHYARLVGHLKRDILQLQPLDQSDFDTAPKILPQGSIVWFLDKALEIPLEVVQESWELLKDYLWECKKVPLNKVTTRLLKHMAGRKGLVSTEQWGLGKNMTVEYISDACIQLP